MFKRLKFAKPKGPGYGISKNFYLTVLATRANLPSISSIVNPRGDGGAVVGYGVPLAAGTNRDDLHRPMARGAYAVTTPEKSTVLRCLVVSKEEAGFDSEAIIRSPQAQHFNAESLQRLRATWTLIQFCFESHHPAVGPALRFLFQAVARTAFLTDGTIADPLSRRYLLPTDLADMTSADGVDATHHVAVHSSEGVERIHCFTLGLQKFSLPEMEMPDVNPDQLEIAKSALLGVAQSILAGGLLSPGDQIGHRGLNLFVAEGGLDKGRWEGIPCLDLLPPKGKAIAEVLDTWALRV